MEWLPLGDTIVNVDCIESIAHSSDPQVVIVKTVSGEVFRAESQLVLAVVGMGSEDPPRKSKIVETQKKSFWQKFFGGKDGSDG